MNDIFEFKDRFPYCGLQYFKTVIALTDKEVKFAPFGKLLFTFNFAVKASEVFGGNIGVNIKTSQELKIKTFGIECHQLDKNCDNLEKFVFQNGNN